MVTIRILRGLHLCFLWICFSTIQSFAQKGMSLLFGLDFAGITNNYSFQQNQNVLNHGWLNKGDGIILNPGIALNNRFSRYFGWEIGIQFSERDLMVYDQRFANKYHISKAKPANNLNGFYADNGSFDIAKWYFTPYMSGYFFLDNKSGVHPYFGGGMGMNIFMSANTQVSGAEHYAPTGEILQLTGNYNSFYYNGFIETGLFFYTRMNSFQTYLKNGHVLKRNIGGGPYIYLGLRYFIAGFMVSGDYANTLNNTVQYTDHVAASGSYLALTFRIGGRILKKKFKGDENNRIVDVLHKKENPGLNRLSKNIVVQQTKPTLLEGRPVEVVKDIHVKNKKIKIIIWDHQNVDNDVLSLNLNEKWILKDYALQTDEKIIKIDLKEDIEYLVMFTISEGRYSPCTAAIIIDDGKTRQQIIMDSNISQSSAIKISVIP